jgi:hypothetical protein
MKCNSQGDLSCVCARVFLASVGYLSPNPAQAYGHNCSVQYVYENNA